jgi:hypothetical protein
LELLLQSLSLLLLNMPLLAERFQLALALLHVLSSNLLQQQA